MGILRSRELSEEEVEVEVEVEGGRSSTASPERLLGPETRSDAALPEFEESCFRLCGPGTLLKGTVHPLIDPFTHLLVTLSDTDDHSGVSQRERVPTWSLSSPL